LLTQVDLFHLYATVLIQCRITAAEADLPVLVELLALVPRAEQVRAVAHRLVHHLTALLREVKTPVLLERERERERAIIVLILKTKTKKCF
jgi:hypothetical protein